MPAARSRAPLPCSGCEALAQAELPSCSAGPMSQRCESPEAVRTGPDGAAWLAAPGGAAAAEPLVGSVTAVGPEETAGLGVGSRVGGAELAAGWVAGVPEDEPPAAFR